MKVKKYFKYINQEVEYEAIEYNNYIHYLKTDIYFGFMGALINNNHEAEIEARDKLIALYEKQIIPNLIKIIKENL